MAIKIFVSGFPLDIQKIDLAKIIAIHGDIETLKIVRDKKTRICKGYAFVEMKTIEAAEATVEALDGAPLAGKTLTLKISQDPPDISSSNTSFNKMPIYQKVERPPAGVKPKRPRTIN